METFMKMFTPSLYVIVLNWKHLATGKRMWYIPTVEWIPGIRERRPDCAQRCPWLSGASLWARLARHESYKLFFQLHEVQNRQNESAVVGCLSVLLPGGGLSWKRSREMTRGHFEFDANKFDNLGEMENLSERHNQPKLIQEEITWIALFTIKFK